MLAIDDFRYALLSKYLEEIGFETKVRKNLKMVRPSDIMKVAPVIDSVFVNHWFCWGDAPELRWATNNTKLVRAGRKPEGKMTPTWGIMFMEKLKQKAGKQTRLWLLQQQ